MVLEKRLEPKRALEKKMRWRMCFCFERDNSPPLFRYRELRKTSRDSEIFDARGRPLNG